MNKDGTETDVTVIPNCDLCAYEKEQGKRDVINLAVADAATVQGSWAYVCEHHLATYCYGLGVGRGQRLRLVKR